MNQLGDYTVRYSKVRFSCPVNGQTAAIVLSEEQQQKMTITEISRLFPMFEAPKMKRLERGEWCDSIESALLSEI